ncbi:BatA domain-containing protein [Marivirga arenosa]|uniref:BatA domain-containing protein n=1 Tax=Marivirga arenosa TaxID=3059076 RepID=A0AA51N5P2_9BACT|nr:BatA domain-containing protein [Marivirga sp. ABR2-2]WMN06776.1 BatA domain-containing protein [Marivirga sp. ABR2-2]
MSLTNSIAFYGLLALIIPIVIHLWSKNKTKLISLGSIQFLKESSTQRSNKIAFSEKLLFLLRALILVMVVFLMSNLFFKQETEKKTVVLIGEDIDLPNAYISDKYHKMEAIEFKTYSLANKWFLLSELANKRNDIDSVIYIDNLPKNGFVGAIPKLPFDLKIINKGENNQLKSLVKSTDTIRYNLEIEDKLVNNKIENVLQANQNYTSNQLVFQPNKQLNSELILSDELGDLNVNQLVINNSVSSDYTLERYPNYQALLINKTWFLNPLNEDFIVLLISEFIADIAQPEYYYSSLNQLYNRQNEGKLKAIINQDYDEWIMISILLLILSERFISYRKHHG